MCDICALTQTFDPLRHAAGPDGSPQGWALQSLPLPDDADDEDNGETPELPTATLDELASYLTTGFWNENEEDSRSFADVIGNSSDHVISVDLTGLTRDGQYLARHALDAWELMADVHFQEQDGGADITFDDTEAGAYVTYDTDGFGRLSADLNVSTEWVDTYGSSLSSYSFTTYLHEIGHTLGLGHMGNYNGAFGSATFANDSYQVSVMSYIAQTENVNVDASLAFPAGPMIADILAVQALYGVSDVTAGNTTWGSKSGQAYAAQFATLFEGVDEEISEDNENSPIAFTIFDLDGEKDRIDLRPSTTDNLLNMRAEGVSDIGGLTGNVVIARDTVIEVALMGSGDDTVSGNGADNVLKGRRGADTLQGREGDDILRGGLGHDRLDGGSGMDVLYGGGGRDRLLGGSMDDQLLGGKGRDYLSGGEGNDVMTGGRGQDSYFFGFGHDQDTIIGFEFGTDRLLFDAIDFGTSNARRLVRTYGEETDEGIVLDFGESITHGASYEDVLTLAGVYDLNALVDDIIFI